MPVQVRPAVPEAASGDNRPFWAIFLCKENSPRRKALRRGFTPSRRAVFWRALLGRPAIVVAIATVETMVDYHGAG